MRERHFDAFTPHCPVCARNGRELPKLVLGAAFDRTLETVTMGILHCPEPACRCEFPVIAGIPLIVPDVARLLAERGLDVLLRQDLPEAVESLLGDALGPDTWFDVARQAASTYGWDGYADLDGGEIAGEVCPGAARRCLAALLALGGSPDETPALVMDVGCGAGRTSFDLAATYPHALVLGIDLHLALLRIASAAGAGVVRYPRRRGGIVYDRREFTVALEGAARVDFWACDAMALPFAGGSAGVVAALNVLDCVAAPRDLLAELARVTAAGGRMLLATPYDWHAQATPIETWVGGHSQRGRFGGDGAAFLRALATVGAHTQSVAGLRIVGEMARHPWHTRLHDRASVAYTVDLLALARDGG